MRRQSSAKNNGVSHRRLYSTWYEVIRMLAW